MLTIITLSVIIYFIMTRSELKKRNVEIVEYKKKGHTFQETLDWVKDKYDISSLNAIFRIWKKYKEAQNG